MLKDLITKNRSYRRFYQEVPIERQALKELVNLARLSPSGANLQPFKFILSNNEAMNRLIFPHLSWASYLKDWPGPIEGERPTAYIIILGDTEISQQFFCSHTIAAHSILLGASEQGLGGCMIAGIKKEGLRQALGISHSYEIMLVLALGKPKEKVIIDKLDPDGDVEYWRDNNGVHHVPKRSLDELIIE